MAIGTPVERFHAAASFTGAYTFSPTANVTNAAKAILIVTNNLAARVVTAVSDTAGNSWSIDKTFNDGVRSISVISCDATSLTTSDVVTVTGPNSGDAGDVWLQEISGLVTGASAFDTFKSNTGTNTAPTSTATPSLAQAAEIAFGICRGSGSLTSFTPGAGWTGTTTAYQGHSGLEYQIVAATAALTATGTIPSATWLMAAVTYKGALAGVPPVNTVYPAASGSTAAGSTLTTTTGTWTDDGSPSFAYQWQRDERGFGAFADIAAGTSSSYVLQKADGSCMVRSLVSNIDAFGVTSAPSNELGPMAATASVHGLGIPILN